MNTFSDPETNQNILRHFLTAYKQAYKESDDGYIRRRDLDKAAIVVI